MLGTDDQPCDFQFEALPVLPEPYETAAQQVESDVVGLIMLGVLTGMERIDPAWFSCFDKFLIFDAELRLYTQGVSPDCISVCELLDQDGTLQQAGCLVGVAKLASQVKSYSDVSDMARLLEGFALMRYRIGRREGQKVLMPLADAISGGVLHGKSWVINMLDLHNYQMLYIGNQSALLDDNRVRVCYAYLEPLCADQIG
ncbi:DnaB-like helicase N-terminal domain-containing protein [Azotobacter chroococcum]|uniref:DnaB-like helicase N-terminal domain-containing protein n=1 Tax=Azotobacter chroococcum TaxID=353 RepID=UPI0010ADB922|nr:DnaB-like helicase N-terminal domain-containing protein [Azotobacter chroococcum]TKD40692.1 hypothetical protein FCG41_09170 [Azotobacter chroococcum]